MSIEEARKQAGMPIRDCIQCGNCCKKINLNLIPPPEVIELLGAHKNREVDRLVLSIQHGCAQLEEIEPGKYRCKIYDKRPKICRDFICSYMLGDDVGKYVEIRITDKNII